VTAGIDHLVYACPELQAAVDELAAATGARAENGGQHPGQGTRNALLGLGGHRYLEIIAPDPGQPEPAAPRPFGLDHLTAAGLRAWAAAPADLDAAVRAASAAGHDPGPAVAGRRRTPGGHELRWRMTQRDRPDGSGAVAVEPFLIDWAGSPHPALSAPAGLVLQGFVIFSPDPDGLDRLLRALGLEVPVERAEVPGLRAELRGLAGGQLTLCS
jgi:Glyoxalase-like domain